MNARHCSVLCGLAVNSVYDMARALGDNVPVNAEEPRKAKVHEGVGAESVCAAGHRASR